MKLVNNSNKYWGPETDKAIKNFSVSSYSLDEVFIKSLAYVKMSCAQVNVELGYLDAIKGEAIVTVCKEICEGKWIDQIVVDPFQGGAGTSTNMNLNEVIANLALKKLGKEIGDFEFIDPLSHVNLHQSTNDVFPTALKVAVLFYLKELGQALSELQRELQNKETEFQNVLKLARTQLQDALPMTLGMTFGAMAEATARDRWRIFKSRERIKTVNLGGTAIGTGLNAPRKYIFKVTDQLRKLTGFNISRSENLIDSTQNLDPFVEISGMLKACAANLLKISTDLRILSSGPNGGFNEIELPALQKGSTIMPGKVNPVIPEMVSQAAIKVMSNDMIIAQCSASGNLELNQFVPLLGFAILESLQLLSNTVKIFSTDCIRGIKANPARCLQHVTESKSIAATLISRFGYNKVEELMKQSSHLKISLEDLVVDEGLMSRKEIEASMLPGAMYKLGFTDEDK